MWKSACGLLVGLAAPAWGWAAPEESTAPREPELGEARQIWSAAPHKALTDLVLSYCASHEGKTAVCLATIDVPEPK